MSAWKTRRGVALDLEMLSSCVFYAANFTCHFLPQAEMRHSAAFSLVTVAASSSGSQQADGVSVEGSLHIEYDDNGGVSLSLSLSDLMFTRGVKTIFIFSKHNIRIKVHWSFSYFAFSLFLKKLKNNFRCRLLSFLFSHFPEP